MATYIILINHDFLIMTQKHADVREVRGQVTVSAKLKVPTHKYKVRKTFTSVFYNIVIIVKLFLAHLPFMPINPKLFNQFRPYWYKKQRSMKFSIA